MIFILTVLWVLLLVAALLAMAFAFVGASEDLDDR